MPSSSATSSHSHYHHHFPSSRTSPPSSSGNSGLTQSLNYSHSSSSTPVNSLTRGGSGERSSFGKGKNRSKSPALLRFFVRGSGGSRKTSEVEEEDYGSSGSDHEDPFSVSIQCLMKFWHFCVFSALHVCMCCLLTCLYVLIVGKIELVWYTVLFLGCLYCSYR